MRTYSLWRDARSFAAAIGAALALAVSFSVPTVAVAAELTKGYGYDSAKFQAELVAARKPVETKVALRSDLRREGNGFLLASVDEYDGLDPVRT